MASNVHGEQLVLDTLRAIEKAGEDTKPAMQGVARTVHTRVMVGFKQGRSPAGVPWTPLAIRNGQPLRDKGLLQRSINPRATQTEAAVGTNRKHMHVHQYGATIKAKNHPYLTFKAGGRWVRVKQVEIPARPFLPLTDSGQTELPPAWATDVENTVLRHFQRATGAA